MNRVTVKDLAKELNLSLASINKAFSGKPGLSDETRQRILETAQQMGYRTNRVAQSLARSPMCIGIIIPDAWTEYYGCMRYGIDQELERLQDNNIFGKYLTVPWLHSKSQETIDAFEACREQQMNAVIFCTSHKIDYSSCIRDLKESGIPTVTLGSDLVASERLSCVRVDADRSGRIAAEFMSWAAEPGKSFGVFIGEKDNPEHLEKVEGFQKESKSRGRDVQCIYETYDEPQVAYVLTEIMLRENPDIGGIYIATGNCKPVCDYLAENKIENIRVVGTDIFNDTFHYVNSCQMQGVVYQNPVLQGKMAVRILYERLVNKTDIESNILVNPQIALKSNIEAYYKEFRSVFPR